jgi:hypothetical protein
MLAPVLLVATAGVWPTKRAAVASPTPAFGVQFHGMWSSYTDAQREDVLAKLAAAHVQWIRLDVSWAMLQPNGPASPDPSSWGVQFVNRVINMAAEQHLKVLVTLWMTPGWANDDSGDRALPHDPNAYARAAHWAAHYWAGKVQAWEIWNEPNDNHFMVGADPAAYTKLLCAAYPAIHAGNPRAKVVFGGTRQTDTAWIRQTYDRGAHGCFDVMAIHPYQAVANEPPSAPDNGTMYRMAHVSTVHQLMVSHGDGAKPIWFTEFGWSSHSNASVDMQSGADNWLRGVSESQQAAYLVDTLRLIPRKWPYVTNAFWYDSRDRTGSHLQDDNYGLLRSDLTPKPAYRAVSSYLNRSEPPARTRVLHRARHYASHTVKQPAHLAVHRHAHNRSPLARYRSWVLRVCSRGAADRVFAPVGAHVDG